MKRTALKHRGPRAIAKERARAERTIEREMAFSRDRHTCQVAVVGAATGFGVGACFGRLTPHHRRKEGQGGAYVLANLATACCHHNDELEADADLARWAHGVGLVVRRGDPEWESLGE